MAKDSPSIHLNLDTLERGDAPDPFGFVLGGDRLVCADPQDLDYRAFDEIPAGDLLAQFRVLLADDEQFEKFKAQKLPLWKMRKLSSAIMEHYGMGEGSASASS